MYRIKEFNKESKDAPDLFQIPSKERTKKQEHDLINKEETITLLSRNKSWITVTPRSKNRRKPLENIRVKNDEPSPVLPQWMRPKFHQKITPDIFKKVDSTSVRTRKRTMQLVDINNLNNNPSNRSIFSIGDYRHNLAFKQECENQLNISYEPKKFFDWDDGRYYNNKKKKDYV